jgi:hypothetical protein
MRSGAGLTLKTRSTEPAPQVIPSLSTSRPAWCISCQVNEKAVLGSSDVEAQLASHNFVRMRADRTKYDPEITKQLASVGRSGVPTCVLYPARAQSKADVLPEILTKDIALEAVRRDAQYSPVIFNVSAHGGRGTI